MAVLVGFPKKTSDGSTQTIYINPDHVQKLTPSASGDDECLIHFGASENTVVNMPCHAVAGALSKP